MSFSDPFQCKSIKTYAFGENRLWEKCILTQVIQQNTMNGRKYDITTTRKIDRHTSETPTVSSNAF